LLKKTPTGKSVAVPRGAAREILWRGRKITQHRTGYSHPRLFRYNFEPLSLIL